MHPLNQQPPYLEIVGKEVTFSNGKVCEMKWPSNFPNSQNEGQSWIQHEKTSEIAVWIVQIRQEMTEIFNFSHIYSFVYADAINVL